MARSTKRTHQQFEKKILAPTSFDERNEMIAFAHSLRMRRDVLLELVASIKNKHKANKTKIQINFLTTELNFLNFSNQRLNFQLKFLNQYGTMEHPFQ